MSDHIDNQPPILDDRSEFSGASSMRSSNATAQTGGSGETEHGTGLDAQSSTSAPESLLSDNNSEAAAGNPLPADLAREFEAALQNMRHLAQQFREAVRPIASLLDAAYSDLSLEDRKAVVQVAGKLDEFYDAYGVWEDIAVKANRSDYIIEERFKPDSIFEEYKDDGLDAEEACMYNINKRFEQVTRNSNLQIRYMDVSDFKDYTSSFSQL